MPNVPGDSWRGLADSRPSSSNSEKPNEGGSGKPRDVDWKGELDNRPKSSGTGESVNVGTGK